MLHMNSASSADSMEIMESHFDPTQQNDSTIIESRYSPEEYLEQSFEIQRIISGENSEPQTVASQEISDSQEEDTTLTSSQFEDCGTEYNEVVEDDEFRSEDEDDFMDEEEEYALYEAELSSSPSIHEEVIDCNFVHAIRGFEATVEGQVDATKGDMMILLDDSNSYWWLVKMCKNLAIGYLPAEYIETPSERLARLNKYKNSETSNSQQSVTLPPLDIVEKTLEAPSPNFRIKRVTFTCSSNSSDDEMDSENDYEAMVNRTVAENGLEIEFSDSSDSSLSAEYRSESEDHVTDSPAYVDLTELEGGFNQFNSTSFQSTSPLGLEIVETEINGSSTTADSKNSHSPYSKFSSAYPDAENSNISKINISIAGNKELYGNATQSDPSLYSTWIANKHKTASSATVDSPLRRSLSVDAMQSNASFSSYSSTSNTDKSLRPSSYSALSESSNFTHDVSRDNKEISLNAPKSIIVSQSDSFDTSNVTQDAPNDVEKEPISGQMPNNLSVQSLKQLEVYPIRHSVSIEMPSEKLLSPRLYSSSTPSSPTKGFQKDDEEDSENRKQADKVELSPSSLLRQMSLPVDSSSQSDAQCTTSSVYITAERKAFSQSSIDLSTLSNHHVNNEINRRSFAGGFTSLADELSEMRELLHESPAPLECNEEMVIPTPELDASSAIPSSSISHDEDLLPRKNTEESTSSSSFSSLITSPASLQYDENPFKQSVVAELNNNSSSVPFVDSAHASDIHAYDNDHVSTKNKEFNRRLREFILDPDSLSGLYWSVKSAGVRASRRVSRNIEGESVSSDLDDIFANVLKGLSDEMASLLNTNR
ncbi:Tip elongation aberrant protein Tea4 [Schizosaccharomyces pombe]